MRFIVHLDLDNSFAQVAQLVGLLSLMMNKHNAVFEVVLVNLQVQLKKIHKDPTTSLNPLVKLLPWDRVPFLVEEVPKPVMLLFCAYSAPALLRGWQESLTTL